MIVPQATSAARKRHASPRAGVEQQKSTRTLAQASMLKASHQPRSATPFAAENNAHVSGAAKVLLAAELSPLNVTVIGGPPGAGTVMP
jgi:hypothetical protein